MPVCFPLATQRDLTDTVLLTVSSVLYDSRYVDKSAWVTHGIRGAVLYGAVARGDEVLGSHPDTDVDLFLIGLQDKWNLVANSFARHLQDQLSVFGIHHEVHIYSAFLQDGDLQEIEQGTHLYTMPGYRVISRHPDVTQYFPNGKIYS